MIKAIQRGWIALLILMFSLSGLAQEIIQGKVIAVSSGEPLLSVSVFIKELQNGTTTDMDGKFQIIVDELPVYLIVSYTGYKQKEIIVEDDSFLNIQLILSSGLINRPIIITGDNPFQISMPAPLVQLNQKALQRDNDITIATSLNRVPGLYMHSGALNTNRLTIRGIGNRSAFSTTKIRAYLDDIPLTTGDGETTIEDIDLSIVDKVNVWKGPTASIYGAGLGGMIHLQTDHYWNFTKKSSISSKITLGSYGLLRNTTNLSLANKENTASFKINYNNTHSEGYRDNNEYDREGIMVLGKLKSDERNETTLLVNFKKVKSFIPSSLSKIDFDKDPQKAAFTWGRIKGFEDYEKLLIGISHKIEIGQIANNYLNNKTSVFSSFRNAYESRPFNILDENSQSMGLRTSFEFNKEHESVQPFPNLSIGMEVFQENYKWQTFVTNDGKIGNNLSNNFERRNYINLFAQTYQTIANKWTILAGFNLNRTHYNYEDRYFADSIDLSGNYAFDWVLSPQLGCTYQVNKSVAFFATMSHGFSPPALEETLTPDGAVNPEIQPEKGWNFELGSRGNFGNKLSYEISAYHMRVKDLLVSERVGEDQFVGVNAGQTQHSGLEFYGAYQILDYQNKLSTFVSYTYKDYVFVDFVNGDKDFSGNKLTGTSPHHFNFGVDVDLKSGIYGNVNYQFVDAFPVRDDNTLASDAYQITNLKFGYKRLFFDKFQFNIYGGIQNVFNEKYAAMILINASSFGGSLPRYYYPGLPRNYFGGLDFKWYF